VTWARGVAVAVTVGLLGAGTLLALERSAERPAVPVVTVPAELLPSTVPPCAMEDSPGPCHWDARTMGDAPGGRSFVVDGSGAVHYLTG